MAVAGCATAAGFAAAKGANEDATAEDFLERWQTLEGESTTSEKRPHDLHYFSRKTEPEQGA